jgi:glycogen debranching enzyme
VLECGAKVVHNGWVADMHPEIDFAQEPNFNYLKREVNIWSDSIKLRYGNCPSDSPYLWQHMTEYVQKMAQVFDGFRLDNAHSTPMHVCHYLLQVARCHNPNLFIMAELFTPSLEYDTIFSKILNINGNVRELQNREGGRQIGAYFHQLTCRENQFGQIEAGTTLTPSHPHDIIYDMTHDNPSLQTKFGNRVLALPLAALLSSANQIIASTWGYDQLLPKKLSVVSEKKLYPIE